MVNSLILINNDEVRANALLNKFMYSRKVGVQSVWEKYICIHFVVHLSMPLLKTSK